jgi:serine/threonine protein kinase, bacterial
VAIAAAAVLSGVAMAGQVPAPESADLQVGVRPVAVAVNPTTNQAFVLNRGSQDLMVIDLAKRSVISKYVVGGIPEGLAVNPKTNAVVVVSLSGEVTIVDHARGQIAGVLPSGKGSSRAAIDTEKNLAWVTNFNGRNVVGIDISGRRIAATVDLAVDAARNVGPLGIAIAESKRRAAVACQYDMQVVVFNLDSYAIERKLLLGFYVSEMAANPLTGMVAAVNPSGNGILVIYDSAINEVTSTVPMGSGPLSVAVYAKKNLAVVAEFSSGAVTLVDMESGKPIKSVKVPKGPVSVAVNETTGLAVVACKLADKVAFIDLNELIGEPAKN